MCHAFLFSLWGFDVDPCKSLSWKGGKGDSDEQRKVPTKLTFSNFVVCRAREKNPRVFFFFFSRVHLWLISLLLIISADAFKKMKRKNRVSEESVEEIKKERRKREKKINFSGSNW